MSGRKAGRLPLHVECAGTPPQRQRIWNALRLHQPISALELQEKCGRPWISEDAIQHYLNELRAAGWAEPDARCKRAGHRFASLSWGVVRDSLDAPRTGSSFTAGLGVVAMWRAMKALKEFDYFEVARAASLPGYEVRPETAKRYVNALDRAGYFLTVRAAKPARAGYPARHRLVRDTGVHPPAITRGKSVFDRNEQQFMGSGPAKPQVSRP